LVKEYPIFVESYFKIVPNQVDNANLIQQTLYFYYKDPAKNYLSLIETGALKGELEFIQDNLQLLIDEDDIYINNKKHRMIIQETKLEFQREDPEFPFLIFKIISTPFHFINHETNEIYLNAKPEVITYPAISSWETYIGKFISIISPSSRILSKDQKQVTFLLAKGDTVGGDEKLMISAN